MRELDVILLHALSTVYPQLDEPDKAVFASLLEQPDQDIFDWVSGRSPSPAAFDTVTRLISTHLHRVPGDTDLQGLTAHKQSSICSTS
ncbi:MAG: hypothetical protein CMO26_02425 [Thiotrichales bacterium]|nr:hypothetical protein [Thiotrichales bacterium]